MSRTALKSLSGLALVGLLAALAPSCADNNQSLFIRQVQQVVAPDCIAKNDPTAAFVSGGQLDVSQATSYSVAALVGSQLISRGNTAQSHAETDRVVFQGADVHLDDGGFAYSGDFSVTPVNGTVDSTSSPDAAYGVAFVSLIPPQIGKLYHDKFKASGGLSHDPVIVKATFKVYGTTLGNQTVESAAFTFPITLVYGRTIDFTTYDPTTGKCTASTTGSTTTSGFVANNCYPGVDGPTPCYKCVGTVCLPCKSDAQCTPYGSTCNLSFGQCN